MRTLRDSLARALLSTDARSHHEASGQDEHEERLLNTRCKPRAFGTEELVDKGGPAVYQDGPSMDLNSDHCRCFETEIVETTDKSWLELSSGVQARDWSIAQIVSYFMKEGELHFFFPVHSFPLTFTPQFQIIPFYKPFSFLFNNSTIVGSALGHNIKSAAEHSLFAKITLILYHLFSSCHPFCFRANYIFRHKHESAQSTDNATSSTTNLREETYSEAGSSLCCSVRWRSVWRYKLFFSVMATRGR